MEQLTYDSSSEDDIQIGEHDSETDSDDQDVAPPTKKQKIDLKLRKKLVQQCIKQNFSHHGKANTHF